ncbi:hypothetical protein [Bdellovibrio sp.]|uniref:hypothetical protein n=1 Tax=Bdellovibrio sp. TaxID=28201 RepID=UPI0039E24A2E
MKRKSLLSLSVLLASFLTMSTSYAYYTWRDYKSIVTTKAAMEPARASKITGGGENYEIFGVRLADMPMEDYKFGKLSLHLLLEERLGRGAQVSISFVFPDETSESQRRMLAETLRESLKNHSAMARPIPVGFFKYGDLPGQIQDNVDQLTVVLKSGISDQEVSALFSELYEKFKYK